MFCVIGCPLFHKKMSVALGEIECWVHAPTLLDNIFFWVTRKVHILL